MYNTYKFRQHISLSSTELATGSSVTGTYMGSVDKLLLTVYGGNAQIRFDGITPTSITNGQRILEGQTFELELKKSELDQVRIRSFSGTVTAEIELFEGAI